MAWTGWLVTAHRVKCNRSSSRCSGTYVMWHWSIKNRLSASTARPCARDRLVGGWATDCSFTGAIPNQSAQISMQSQWQCLETDPGVRQGHSHQFNWSKTDKNRKAIFSTLAYRARNGEKWFQPSNGIDWKKRSKGFHRVDGLSLNTFWWNEKCHRSDIKADSHRERPIISVWKVLDSSWVGVWSSRILRCVVCLHRRKVKSKEPWKWSTWWVF